jgi:hypothetical protein
MPNHPKGRCQGSDDEVVLEEVRTAPKSYHLSNPIRLEIKE